MDKWIKKTRYMEGALTWRSEHTIQYLDDVLQNYTHETYRILLTSFIPINSVKFLKYEICIYIQSSIFSLKTEEYSAICDSMSEPGGNYVK